MTAQAAFYLSHWYGILDTVGPPGEGCTWGTECLTEQQLLARSL
jgi:hypothetical protein